VSAEAERRVRWIRWKAALPLALVVAIGALIWVLYLDRAVERGVEEVGTRLIGALVELESADVRIAEGVVRLTGLQVTDPGSPMTNLVQADELTLNVRTAPLLQKKLIIDTMSALGVRFGTPRETSGAVDLPDSPETGLLMRQVDQWTSSVDVPPLSLAGLSRTVDVSAFESDSLATLRGARALKARTDSMRAEWETRLAGLDPRPSLDTARALLARIEGQSLRSLGLGGVRSALTTGRSTVSTLGELGDRLGALQGAVDAGVDSLRTGLATVADLRAQDYRYALGLLAIPSLSAPELGPSLFGDWAKERARPVMYWLGLAEQYMPPGVRRQLRPGPSRARSAGTDVLFPRSDDDLPRFLVGLAEATVELSGQGAAAGSYAARILDLTSNPARLGRPTRVTAERLRGASGPETATLSLVLDHTGAVARDSARATATGVPLPSFALAPLGGRVSLGAGTGSFTLAKEGEQLALAWSLSSSSVAWTRAEGREPSRIESVLWGAVSRLDSLAVDLRLAGSLSDLSLSVSSNVADAVARGLRELLGAEVEAARARVRSEVDQRIAAPLAEARTAVGGVETDVRARVEALRAELAEVRPRLEAEIRRLTGLGGSGSP
jgi:uncharacterized protein (TIGR03545 family)